MRALDSCRGAEGPAVPAGVKQLVANSTLLLGATSRLARLLAGGRPPAVLADAAATTGTLAGAKLSNEPVWQLRAKVVSVTWAHDSLFLSNKGLGGTSVTAVAFRRRRR